MGGSKLYGAVCLPASVAGTAAAAPWTGRGYLDGRFHTEDKRHRWPQAMAIKGGRCMHVGDILSIAPDDIDATRLARTMSEGREVYRRESAAIAIGPQPS